jgi:hypothetical protein
MLRRSGVSCVAGIAGIGIAIMASSATVRVLGRMMRHRRVLGWRVFRRFFVRRLGVFLPGIAVILVAIAFAIAGIDRLCVGGSGAIRARVAAGELRFAVVAQLAKGELLLGLKVAANIGFLAVRLVTLRQFIILAAVQTVDLVIEIDLQFFARVW